MGYELERFERAEVIKELMPELICSICQDVFRKPTRIKPCEHVFCHTCLDTWLKTNPKCPICRVTVPKKITATADDRMITSMLDKLKIFCKFKQNGCRIVVELSLLETHELYCIFDPESETTCGQGCGATIRQSDLQEHNCIATLKNRIEELITDNNNQKQCIEKLIEDNMSLKHCVSPLKRKIDELETQCSGLVKRMDKMAAQMSGCDDEDDADGEEEDDVETDDCSDDQDDEDKDQGNEDDDDDPIRTELIAFH